jgi:hypothetical protein
MFLNIRACSVPGLWLSMFPRKNGGEQIPLLETLETFVAPTVPPFPRFIFTGTFGMYGNPGEVAQ